MKFQRERNKIPKMKFQREDTHTHTHTKQYSSKTDGKKNEDQQK